MQVAQATEVRKNWSSFFDQVVHDKPQAVRRNRDTALFLSKTHMEEILSQYRFTLEYEIEEDGYYSGGLKEIDICWSEPSLEELKQTIAKDLVEYAKTYMDNFALYHNAPNRRDHFPYVMHVLMKDNIQEVVELIDADWERT
ncbi:hypothetical protein [Thermoflavimicrobium dichotomicum]|uniref:Antitoxin of toxin-antitoxin, RelE / RelB, TA system n=1 Tax=Thermoflavimicrobium dichotomicum TaxID=46223 RepID=A0A1I3LJQ6_9BACL|nr:hypothetical protein [Thermoflavimicrobium dichotomicum]SFI84685.1 Antitoxin of toxin-antitoxin, RelE / RelB, TA system [Thermoflavimicrobium dichotomicum]